MLASVIIPTFHAEAFLPALLERLLTQTVRAEILVVDTSPDDAAAAAALRCAPRVRLLRLSPAQFDHGGTRHLALRATEGEFVFFFSQDALPVDERFLETMLTSFADPTVAGAFARQLARADAPDYERLTRAFNYPPVSRVWGAEDIPRRGVKAFFFSNAASVYRRSAYEAVGGFDRGVPANEDMLLAARLLHAGYRLCYRADACVLHSHAHTLTQEFERNRRIGQVMVRYGGRFGSAAPTNEGARLVGYVTRELLRTGKTIQAADFLLHAAARGAGFAAGALQERL